MSFISKLKSKPRSTKTATSGTSRPPLFLLQPYVNASIADGSFKKIVILPKYVEDDEWLAANVFEFYTYLNLFYGSIADFCTLDTCPTMGAGIYPDYQWVDPHTRKSSKVPARTYIDYAMTWIDNTINDESVFPTKAGREFPRDFPQIVRAIFKQSLRVFAHIYHHHYEQILNLCEEGHLNALFAHFISFGREFNLLDKKDMAPLDELIETMITNGMIG